MPDAPTDNLPYPLLVNALTGMPTPPVPLANFAALASDLPGADRRHASQSILGADPNAVDDANDLTQAGWGILFASDADPAIQAQLQPLIDLRKSQVQDPTLFKVFSGNTGVLPGQTAASWAQQRGVSLSAQVDPSRGVPYYLLIVGGPDRISFEFQALLKMQWAVGRLYFDDIADYGRYAQAVVQYESKSFMPAQSKNSAIWVTRNYGDLATAMLSGVICQDFLPPGTPLGTRRQFLLNAFVNEKATKPQLIEILRGNVPGGPPAVIFTGSHGCDYSGADLDTQRRMQGALMTQEWIPKTPANATNQFSADDIPADAKLLGAIGFIFACYSGACPTESNYYLNPDGTPVKVAPQPMVARLPQALLSRGMLAVIAHIDMAFPYAFQDVVGTPQMQAVRSPLELLMAGKRTGLAADALTSLWSARSAQLGLAQGPTSPAPATGGSLPAAAPASSTSKALAQMTIARDDARNYIVLGDPATQLRVRDLK